MKQDSLEVSPEHFVIVIIVCIVAIWFLIADLTAVGAHSHSGTRHYLLKTPDASLLNLVYRLIDILRHSP